MYIHGWFFLKIILGEERRGGQKKIWVLHSSFETVTKFGFSVAQKNGCFFARHFSLEFCREKKCWSLMWTRHCLALEKNRVGNKEGVFLRSQTRKPIFCCRLHSFVLTRRPVQKNARLVFYLCKSIRKSKHKIWSKVTEGRFKKMLW
jgi:hypothetical protein